MRGDYTVAVADFAQQAELVVGGAKLQVEHAFAQHLTFDGLAVRGSDGLANDGGRSVTGDRRERAEVWCEILHLLVGQGDGGHTAGWAPFADDGRELGFAAGGNLGYDSGSGLAAGGIGTMTARASALELMATGVVSLSSGSAHEEQR